MSRKVYTISQASQIVGKKSYVLRYWEEELRIPINRNELGHRYYTENDIQLFLNIKELQRRGLQLRAIKSLIPRLYAAEDSRKEQAVRLLPQKKEQDAEFAYINGGTQEEDGRISDREKRLEEFQTILEKLISQGLKDQQAREREEKARLLDAAIRSHQETRKQTAAARMQPQKKKARSFDFHK